MCIRDSTKAHLMARHAATAAQLGWDGLRFEAARILDYQEMCIRDRFFSAASNWAMVKPYGGRKKTGS